MSWNKDGVSPAWLIFRHPKDVPKEVQLTLPYCVDERLGFCHLMYLYISHTIKAFDAKHDLVPVVECGKSIILFSMLTDGIQESHPW